MLFGGLLLTAGQFYHVLVFDLCPLKLNTQDFRECSPHRYREANMFILPDVSLCNFSVQTTSPLVVLRILITTHTDKIGPPWVLKKPRWRRRELDNIEELKVLIGGILVEEERAYAVGGMSVQSKVVLCWEFGKNLCSNRNPYWLIFCAQRVELIMPTSKWSVSEKSSN